VCDLAIGDLTADLADLEPVQVAHRLPGPGDPVADRRVDTVGEVPTISLI